MTKVDGANSANFESLRKALPRRLKGRTRTATFILQLSAGLNGIVAAQLNFLGLEKAFLLWALNFFVMKNFALFVSLLLRLSHSFSPFFQKLCGTNWTFSLRIEL